MILTVLPQNFLIRSAVAEIRWGSSAHVFAPPLTNNVSRILFTLILKRAIHCFSILSRFASSSYHPYILGWKLHKMETPQITQGTDLPPTRIYIGFHYIGKLLYLRFPFKKWFNHFVANKIQHTFFSTVKTLSFSITSLPFLAHNQRERANNTILNNTDHREAL